MPKDIAPTTPITPLSKNHVHIQQRLQDYALPPSTDSTMTIRYQIGNLTRHIYAIQRRRRAGVGRGLRHRRSGHIATGWRGIGKSLRPHPNPSRD